MTKGTQKLDFNWVAALCSISLLLTVLIGYYFRIPRLGGWFSNDDFVLLSNYQRTLSFGDSPLADSFFRPITRNFFWWLAGGACSTNYNCFFFINLSILISGIAIFFTAIFKIFLPSVNNKIALIALTTCATAYMMLLPSSISLASWISNTQATISLLLFSIIFYIGTRARDQTDRYPYEDLSLWAILIALAFSNIGYFLTAAAFITLKSILILIRYKTRYSFMRLALILATAFATSFSYKSIILSNVLPNTPYHTQWTLETFEKNISFYLGVDRLSLVLLGVAISLTLLTCLIVYFRRKSGDSCFANEFSSDASMLFTLYFTCITALIPYLSQTMQRNDYYMMLFALLSYGSTLSLALVLAKNLIGNGTLATTPRVQSKTFRVIVSFLLFATVIKFCLSDYDNRFTNYMREPVGSKSLLLMKNIYMGTSSKSICLVPELKIRRDKSHPYYPDDFWWKAGFGKASEIYAGSSDKSILLEYQSYPKDCDAEEIYEVDENLKIFKISN